MKEHFSFQFISKALPPILQKNFTYLIGSIVQSIASLILVLILVRQLSQTVFGYWAFAEVLILLLIMITTFGFDVGLMRYYWNNKDDQEKKEITGTILIAISVFGGALIFISLILIMTSENSAEKNFCLPGKTLIFAILIGFIESLLGIFFALFRIREEAKIFVFLSIGKFVFYITTVLLFLNTNRSVNSILLGRITASLIICLIAFFLSRKHICLKFNKNLFKRIFKYSAPLLPANIFLYGILMMDRYSIQYFLGPEAVAIYAFSLKIVSVYYLIILRPFSLDWAPRRFKIALSNRADDNYVNIFYIFLYTSIIAMLFFIAISPIIYQLFAPESYKAGSILLPTMFLGYLFFALTYPINIGIVLKDKTKYAALISLIVVIVCFILNLFFVPSLQLFGATLAQLLSHAFNFILVAYFSQKFYKVIYNKKEIIKILLFGIIISVGFIFVGVIVTSQITKLIIRLIALIISLLLTMKSQIINRIRFLYPKTTD